VLDSDKHVIKVKYYKKMIKCLGLLFYPFLISMLSMFYINHATSFGLSKFFFFNSMHYFSGGHTWHLNYQEEQTMR
jgi:hypothetical protein